MHVKALYEPFEAFEMAVEGSPPETRDKRCKRKYPFCETEWKSRMRVMRLPYSCILKEASQFSMILLICGLQVKLLSDVAYIHICGDAKGMTQVVPLTHHNIVQEQLKTIPSKRRIGTGRDLIIKYHSNSEVIERATSVQRMDENGSSDLVLFQNALAEFQTGCGPPFTVEACWRILKNHAAWTEIEMPTYQ
ncbi:hypothetical protein Tco_0998256 [Tanacetum coccineum]